jgi:hypothetical protein
MIENAPESAHPGKEREIEELNDVYTLEEILVILEKLDPEYEIEKTTTGQESQTVGAVIQRIKWAMEANDNIQLVPTVIDTERSGRDHWIALLPESYGIKEKIIKSFEPETPIAPVEIPETTVELETADNYYDEKATLEKALESFKSDDPHYATLVERIKVLDTQIADLKGDWAGEEKTAEATLAAARAVYIKEHTKEKESQGGIFVRGARKVFGLKKSESEDFKKATAQYEMMQKRYANAVSQGDWEMHRKLAGDIPYGTPEFETLSAKIKARQIQKVILPEYRKLEKANAETIPPRERNMLQKILGAYTGMSRTKRILIGAAITSIPAATVSGLLFAGTVAHKAIRAAIAITVGTGVAERYGIKKNEEVNEAREEAVQELNDTYNLFGNTKQGADMERKFDKEYRKIGLKKAGVAALFGGSSALLLGAIDNAFFKPGQVVTEPGTSRDPVPDSKPIAKIVEPTPPVVKPNIPEPTPPVKPSAPIEHHQTFKDSIEDKMRGSKLVRGDSAELSAKRIFEHNAEKLGYDKSSGMSLRKWAEMKVEQLVKEHPEVRNTITHNGEEIKIRFNADHSVASVAIEQDPHISTKLPPMPEPAPIPSAAELPPVPASALDSVPSTNISHNIDSTVLAKAVGTELPNRISEIFLQKTGFFGSNFPPVMDPRWMATSNIKAETLLNAKFTNVPEFLRVNNIPHEVIVTRDQLTSLQEIMKVGREYGVIVRGMNVGDVVRKVIEKQELGRLLKAGKM